MKIHKKNKRDEEMEEVAKLIRNGRSSKDIKQRLTQERRSTKSSNCCALKLRDEKMIFKSVRMMVIFQHSERHLKLLNI